MRVKEESEKAGLKLNIQKTKIMAFGPITSWHIDVETMEKVPSRTRNNINSIEKIKLQSHIFP